MERRFYEYRGMRGGEHYERMEANPMIGYRGCFRNVAESDLFGIKLAAITHVWESGLSNLHLMTVLLINGPNLAMLGRRDPAQYGAIRHVHPEGRGGGVHREGEGARRRGEVLPVEP